MNNILMYVLVMLVGLGSVNARVMAFVQSPATLAVNQQALSAPSGSEDSVHADLSHAATQHDCCEQDETDAQDCCEGCEREGCATHCWNLSAITNAMLSAVPSQEWPTAKRQLALYHQLNETLYRPPRT